MKYEIMKMSTLQKIQQRTRLVHDTCFEQFVVSVLGWYQHEAINLNKIWDTLEWRVIERDQPPNLFELFEYPTMEAETVINQFVLSEAYSSLDQQPDLAFAVAKEEAISSYNNAYPYIFESMVYDAQLILNAYNLFYYYKDDTENRGRYFNSYIKEIW